MKSDIEDKLSQLHRRISETMNFDFESFSRTWKNEIIEKINSESEDYDLWDISIGWAVGKGMSFEQAKNFSLYLDQAGLL